MIQLPNLDDQVFDDIVETARLRCLQYCPEWTNFNPSDPGLTILELFAWLKEMQQYRLNRITHSGILSCLHLLGISPFDASPAKTIAVFNASTPYLLPDGCPFTAEDGTVFETDKPTALGNGSVFSVWIDNGGGPCEISATGEDIGVAIQPFGESETVDACLYIGFYGIKSTRLSLYFEIDDSLPVPRSPFGDDTEPSRDIVWEYGVQFAARASVQDETRGFSVSGEVVLDLCPAGSPSGGWEASKPIPAMPKCYWLRARLVARGAEESPKIKKFYNNYATLEQRETLCRMTDFDAEGKTVTLTDYRGLNGEHIIFAASGGGGWKRIKLPDSKVTRTDTQTQIKTNSNGSFRVVSVKPGFNALHSTHTNLPNIRLDIPVQGHFSEIALMIEDGGLWQSWEYTRDLHTAGPYDKVFTVDDGCIVFGDNEHGECPPAGTDNVLISSCRVTLGRDGNVLPNLSLRSVPPIPPSGATRNTINETFEAFCARNITPGISGRNPESIQQALTRVMGHLTATDRCVTQEDFEKMASATPGLRIIKTRAATGFDPKTGLFGIPALVTVVVQPYGTSKLPLPDNRMLRRVEKHLEKGRLLGTRVKAVAPEYVPVSVSISVVAAGGEAAHAAIKDKLLEYLSPTQGSLGIGAAVSVADVMAQVCLCPCVSRVLKLTLSAPENMAPIDRSGNVLLPPHRIAYPGEIEVSIRN